MSQVLYRKYRPKLWSEVVGQEHVTRTLQNAIKSGRVVHSYLFSGSRGIGKTTIARLLSKTLNCAERKEEESEPCNQCSNCQSANLGNSLSIIEIDAASHTGVDNVRDKIIENVRFAPSGSKYKVFIIDEAHMLSGSAFNALLKTLEEPPAHAIFILATTELHKLPATILSRCQRFDFKKPSIKEIVGRLQNILALENIKAEKKVLERIAYLSEGGLRDAEGLLGQLISLGTGDIREEDADLALPRSDLNLALKFLEFLIGGNGREAMILIDDLQSQGIDFKYFFNNLIELARKVLYFKITGCADEFLTEEMNKKISVLSLGASQEKLVKILDIIIARKGDVDNLDIPTLPLELATAEICGEPHNVIARPSAEAISSIGEPSSMKAEQTGDLKEITDKWPEVLEKIKNYNHSLPFVLKMSQPISFDGKNLVLAIKFKLHKEKLEDAKSRIALTEALKSVYNKDIQFLTEVNEALDIALPQDSDEVDVSQAFS